MDMQVLETRQDAGGGYKVDVSRGERVGRVSSEWFSRPDDERFLSLGELARAVRDRAERSRTRVVESALIHVEASRTDPERLSLMLPGSDTPVAPTHWSFGQLAAQVGAPAAYLRQAFELESSPTKSAGYSHPESFLRARALELWWQGSDSVEDWIGQRLHGPLSIEALDLLRQQALTEKTRAFLGHFIAADEDPDSPVLTQVRRYFPDFAPAAEKFDLDSIGPEKIDDATRDYFIALMFDCAMADPDLTDGMMPMVAQVAQAMGAEDRLKAALKRDLKWTKGRIDTLIKRAAKAA